MNENESETRKHVLVFDDEISGIVYQHVRRASGPSLEVHAFDDMYDCRQKYEELQKQGEKVVALVMEPILWFTAYTSPQDFANFFIGKGVPVICYSTNANYIMELFADFFFDVKTEVEDGFKVSRIISRVGKGDEEGLRDALKTAEAI